MAKIAVIGCGYVGLGTGAVFADLGNQVVGVEINAARVELLRAGECPIYEPGLEELLARNLKAGRLAFTTDYARAIPEADFVFICVNTPSGPHGGADMSYVRTAARSVGQHLAAGRRTVVVNKSTMPIGSGDLVGALLGEAAVAGARFAVVSNPEFLREGSAVQDMLNPDRVVLGSADRAAVRPGGRVDADEDEVGVGDSGGVVGGEGQPPRLQVAPEQLLQPRLVDRALAGAQQLHARGVDLHPHHLVPQVGEDRPRPQTHVPAADHRNLRHTAPLVRFKIPSSKFKVSRSQAQR